MISGIVTSYLYNLARRLEDGLVDWQPPPARFYDMADVTQLRDLAQTLDDERTQGLTTTLSEFRAHHEG